METKVYYAIYFGVTPRTEHTDGTPMIAASLAFGTRRLLKTSVKDVRLIWLSELISVLKMDMSSLVTDKL